MYRLNFVIALLVIIFLLGCSSGKNAIMPQAGSKPDSQMSSSYNALPVFVSESDLDGNPTEGMGIMGLFDLIVTPENSSLVSLRQSSLTDVLEVVDISNFLQLAPCTDCARLQSVQLNSDGNLVATIGIKHPFDVGDPLKPISGRNRADLHVFNVEGILISDNAAIPFPVAGETIADFRLLNADGYTGYLDDSLDEIFPTDASIHPYITFFDDYSAGNFDPAYPTGFQSVTDPPPSGNLVMAMGCEYNNQDFIFDMDEPVNMIFAIGCTYAVSAASKHDRFSPEYRIPQHNKKSASEISIEIISNDLAADNIASTAEIEISVVDVSHGVGVGESLNEMFADSSVGAISVNIPGVMSDALIIDGGTSISGSGHDPSDPLIYAGTITNSANGDEDTHYGLIKVTDSYPPGSNTNPLIGSNDGIKRVGPLENPLVGVFAITEFASYQVFEISVGAGGEPPICDLQVSDLEVGQGATISANPGTSNDPDGAIVSYEYDTDYDGVTFDSDIVQNSVDPDFGDPVDILMPCNTTGLSLIVTIALRVCDDNPSQLCTICTQDVTVTEKLGSPGDISVVALNRGEDGANENLLTSVDLDWEDNPCGVTEYVIERADGYSGIGWIEIGTTTTSDYKFQLSGNDWDDDIRLRVIARAVIGGDPASDSDPSEEVFLLFISNGGYQIPGNKWVGVTESRYRSVFSVSYWVSGAGPNPGADNDFWWGTNSSVYAMGIVAWGYIWEHVGYTASINRWSIMRSSQPFPDLDGQKEVFCDGFYWTNYAWADGSMGLCLGTITEPNPSIYSEFLYDFEPSNDVYDTGRAYDFPDLEGLINEFDAPGQDGWQQLGTNSSAPWSHIGYYLNGLLEEDRDYPAIGLAIGSTPLPDREVTVGWSDAWVFVIH